MTVITFRDGPAAGVVLELKRAPVFLRVVQHGTTFDALDQLDDEPTAMEAIVCYRRIGEAGSVHLDGRDAKTGKRFGKWLAYAEYRLYVPQPTDEIMRARSRWRAWCELEHDRLTKVHNDRPSDNGDGRDDVTILAPDHPRD